MIVHWPEIFDTINRGREKNEAALRRHEDMSFKRRHDELVAQFQKQIAINDRAGRYPRQGVEL